MCLMIENLVRFGRIRTEEKKSKYFMWWCGCVAVDCVVPKVTLVLKKSMGASSCTLIRCRTIMNRVVFMMLKVVFSDPVRINIILAPLLYFRIEACYLLETFQPCDTHIILWNRFNLQRLSPSLQELEWNNGWVLYTTSQPTKLAHDNYNGILGADQ